MNQPKQEGSGLSSSVSSPSRPLAAKHLPKAKKHNSLVPYCDDSSDSSQDEMRSSDISEFRKKTLSSPRKRKKNIGKCMSGKIFSDSSEDQFSGCFPTTSDGFIDTHRLFNSDDKSWTEKLVKTLNKFPLIS